jgi:ThiF family
MSTRLIARSADLSRLRNEGYEVSVRDAYVLVESIPYVTSTREIARGTMVIALTTAGEETASPPDHTVRWTGSMPCHCDGTPITRIDAGAGDGELAPGLVARHRFSSKPQPAGKYSDYYEQFTAYIRVLVHEAQALDPTATATTFSPVATTEDESVFRYCDTATSRAGIGVANAKLEADTVAIVGAGGSGSYVLDLVAKTPVRKIHVFDNDLLFNHNAFRAPGAASLDELRRRPLKVDYLVGIYDRMRRGVIGHAVRLGEHNADELAGMSFVFLCMDSGPDKRAIIERLEEFGISFIDVGMGLDEHDGSIGGIVRVTTSTPAQRRHVWDLGRITFEDPDDAINEYGRNIQVADLNALNACLAVIRWKKLRGFYRDLDNEHHSLYTLDGNHLLNEDQP